MDRKRTPHYPAASPAAQAAIAGPGDAAGSGPALTRECLVCDGTGEGDSCGPNHGLACCEKHNCCHCEQTFDDVRLNGFSCPVCLGSGRVEEPGVRDTVARNSR